MGSDRRLISRLPRRCFRRDLGQALVVFGFKLPSSLPAQVAGLLSCRQGKQEDDLSPVLSGLCCPRLYSGSASDFTSGTGLDLTW